MINLANRVVKKFGSQSALAQALGTSQTTVAYWVKTRRIPTKWHGEILEAAHARGIELDPMELIEVAAPAAPTDPDDPIARHSGTVHFGPDQTAAVNCYVLDDGRRIISRSSAVAALGGKGGDLASYVKPISMAMRMKLDDELVDFRLEGVTSKRVAGVSAE